MTPEVIVPADPVILTREWLSGRYPWPVTVTKNRPNPTVGRIVTIRRSGGLRPVIVTDAAWLTVECFAPTDIETSELAHLTWGLLHAMEGQIVAGVQCYRVQPLGGPADMPDADAQVPRYVMSVQATFRASAI